MFVYVYVCELLMLLIFIKAEKWSTVFLSLSFTSEAFWAKIQIVRREH